MNTSYAYNAELGLTTLIESGAQDTRLIEFYETLPDATDAGMTQFLGDISSFANASGGHIIYGVDYPRPGAAKIVGVNSSLAHEAMARLRNALGDGIEPAVPGVELSVVNLNSEKAALVVRIPRSWIGPHMLVFQQAYRFMSRNTSGKYFLDVNELRTSFNASSEPTRKLQSFHIDRIHTLVGRPMSINTAPGAKMVLHMLPLAAFHDHHIVNLQEAQKSHLDFLRPMEARGTSCHYNCDGLINFSSIEKYAYSHVQLFRNGCLEASTSAMLSHKDERKQIPGEKFEPEIITCGNRFIELLRRLRIDPPYVARLSFLGIRGFGIYVGAMRWNTHAHPIERDHLFLDDVIVESTDVNFAAAMRPAFDQAWNASGWPGSVNYDEHGNWREYLT